MIKNILIFLKNLVFLVLLINPILCSSQSSNSNSLLEQFLEIKCFDCHKNNPAWATLNLWDPGQGIAVGSTTGSGVLIAVSRISKNGGPIAIPPALTVYKNGKLALSGQQLPNTGIIEANGNHTNKLLIADFDGDGVEDIFAANGGYDRDPYPGQTNTLWKFDNQTWATAPIQNQAVAFNHTAATIDLNRDGRRDVLVGLGNLSINRNNYNNYALTFRNGQFIATTTLADSQVNIHVVAVGDVNGDGQEDIVYGAYEQQGLPYSGSGVLIRNASDGFTKTVFPRPEGVLAHAAGVPAIGDINGDGLVDVVMLYTPAWPSPDRYRKPVVQVLLQSTNGQWIDSSSTNLISYPGFDWTDSYATKAYLADVNNDGQLDLILEVSEKRWDTRRAWLRVLENKKGVLTEGELFLGQDQSRIAIADVDNNGKADIVVHQSLGLKILRAR